MKKDGIQTRKRKPKNPMNVLQANAMMKSDMKGILSTHRSIGLYRIIRANLISAQFLKEIAKFQRYRMVPR